MTSWSSCPIQRRTDFVLPARGQGATIIIGGRADNVVSPPALKLLGRAGLDRSACGLCVNATDAFTL